MAEWGRWHPDLATELGYTRSVTPCAATFCRLFAALDWSALVAIFRTWAERCGFLRVNRRTPRRRYPGPRSPRRQDASGSRKRGGHDCHVLTAVFHEVGLVWTESAVDDKTDD